jgi:putative DNA primase/helicase
VDSGRYIALLSSLRGWDHLTEFKRQVNRLKANAEKAYHDEKAAEALAEAEEAGRAVLAGDTPVDTAARYIAASAPNLKFVDGRFENYDGNCYKAVEDRNVRSKIQAFMAAGLDKVTGTDFKPNKHAVDQVFDAAQNLAFRQADAPEPPTWEPPYPDDLRPQMCLGVANGILDLATGRLLKPTPRFYARSATAFSYDPDATATAWGTFLDSLWDPEAGGDVEQAAFQEWVGYLLTRETKYQKICLLVGPPNAGKGIIVKVLVALLGADNVVSQSLGKLGTPFGLKALLGKTLMTTPDLRLGKNDNVGGIAETMLNISGEDGINVGRKYQDDKQATLGVRLMLVSNMELALADQSGALARRLLPFVLKNSFLGREDVDLLGKLLAELPGILNWALVGLQRLEARRDSTGRQIGFVLTPEGRRMLNHISRRGSPVRAFIADACELREDGVTPKSKLLEVFEQWTRDVAEVEPHHTEEMFARELRVASGNRIESYKPRLGGLRVPHYKGVVLKPEWQDFGY